MLDFYGTHGTSLSRAKCIKAEGFDARPGRIGVGAYFWTATTGEHLPLAQRFAEGWYAKQAYKFGHDEEPGCAVVTVTVSVDEDDILYLDDPEHHLELRAMLTEVVEQKLGVSSIYDPSVGYDDVRRLFKQLNAVVELFITRVEELLERKIKIVFKAQQPPVNDHLRELVGLATCFAVRDTECISEMTIS